MSIDDLAYSVPSTVLATLVVGITVLLSVLGLVIVRRLVPIERLKANHDLADPVLSVIGGLYAVLLAFVVFTVWEQYQDLLTNIRQEAAVVVDVHRDTLAYPPEFRTAAQAQIGEYVSAVIEDEWEKLGRREDSVRTETALADLSLLYASYEPQTNGQTNVHAQTLSLLSTLSDLHQVRVIQSRSDLPSVLWTVLFVGSFATIASSYFFGLDSLRAHAALTAVLAANIALIIFVIIAMDFPFRGDVRITSEPFVRAQQTMTTLRAP
ncbi:MAG: DUF4239 domain-containing protein [Chloroflexia bacterium]